MNQQKTPLQRPPRPQAQRYVGRPIRLPKKCAPPKGLVITTVVTGALLVISLMILSIALIVGPTEQRESDGGGEKKDSAQTQVNTDTPKQPTKKNFLSFPSQTAGGVALSVPSTAVTEDSVIKSQAAILVDAGSGEAIFAQSAEVSIHPASMTKVMTVLVACEMATDPNELLTVTPEMIEALNTKENKTVKVNGFWTSKGASTFGGWQAGDQITVEDALFLANYQSDTIACWLLANRFGCGEQGFVDKMNQKAQVMNLKNTSFVNCTGLENENHKTTCLEMASIMRAAMNNPAAKKVITSYEEYAITVYRNEKMNRTLSMYATWFSKRLENIPKVCNGSDLRFVGGKTGWETTPTACFVTAIENTQTGKQYICVTVGRISQGNSVLEKECAADARYLCRTYIDKVNVDWNKLL